MHRSPLIDTASAAPQKKTMNAIVSRTPTLFRLSLVVALQTAVSICVAALPAAAQTIANQAAPSCAGDCDGDGTVGVDELVRAVTMALDGGGTAQCPPADADGNGTLSIAELVAAVGKAIHGCAASGATLTEIQSTIFDTTCAVTFCHSATFPGSIPAGNLDLTDGNSFAQLVGVQADNISARDAGYPRVDPGNPDNSFIVIKLEGPPSNLFGSQMPSGLPPLSATQIQLVRDWIAAGAKQ
jgi:hypothetical protein